MRASILVWVCLASVIGSTSEAVSQSIMGIEPRAESADSTPAWVADVEAAFNSGGLNESAAGERQQSDRRIEVLIIYNDDASRRPPRERAQGAAENDRPLAEIERQLQDAGIDVVRGIPDSNAVRAVISRQHVEQLATDSNVKAVFPERLLRTQEERGSLERPSLFLTSSFTNADEVWKRGYTGTGQTIVILDNGIFANHVVFGGGKIVQQACFSSPNADSGDTSLCPGGGPSQIGGSAASGNCNAHPKACAHGTHVANIAAGNDPSQFLAYDGIAYNANIIAVQVFKIVTNKASCPDGPCLLASNLDIFEALNWVKSVAASYKIAAVNMSLGGGEYRSFCPQSLLDDPINDLRDIGILSTVASGNDGYVGAVASPGCVEAAITVSATIITFPASWANHAPMVDIMSPGSSIYAAGTPPNSFVSRDGTSMAAPEVAGAIALLRSANPNATADQIAYALRTGGEKNKSFSWKWETTVLDVEGALDKLGGEPPPRGTQVLSVYSSGNSNGTQSYLRFFNSEIFSDTVRVAFVDDLTGKVVGRYSLDVPGDASIQKQVSAMEQAAGINPSGKTTYTAVVNSDFDGFVQHVIFNPIGAALTNVTSCVGGLTQASDSLINVHTSQIPSDYPSIILVHNAGDVAAKAEFRIYEASSGRSLGRAATPTIPSGTTVSYTAQSFYTAISYSPRANEFHTNFELQDGFDGTLLHMVNNTRAGVITNMTDRCAIN